MAFAPHSQEGTVGSIQGMLDWGVALRAAALVGYLFAFLGYTARLAVRKCAAVNA